MTLLLALAAAAGLALPATARAELADISVRAADRKADGKSWRGSGAVFIPIPGMGGVTPQMEVKNAPSMVLCTVTLAGDLACPGAKGRDTRGRLASPCHLSIDCDFMDIDLPPDEAFGLIVISHGMIFTSLVDAVVVSRKKINTRDPAFVSLDEMLRSASERLAPSGSQDERQRRERPFPLKTLDACALSSCSLRQSEWKVVPQ